MILNGLKVGLDKLRGTLLVSGVTKLSKLFV